MNADNKILKNLNKFPACTLDSTEDIIFNTVSFRILLCVFLPQMGQIIHSVCIVYLTYFSQYPASWRCLGFPHFCL